MATYMIGYDLNRRGQDYASLISAIESYGTWWHCLDSTWLIKANGPALAIANHLAQFIDSNDELLVLELPAGTPAAWVGFDEQCVDWLNANL